MGELGEVLGWATGVCFIVAALNYVVKRINKRLIAPMPKDSAVRKYYQQIMKLIVKYHRYVGMAAGLIVIIHLLVQINWQFLSVTGAVAAAILILTALMGVIMLYGHQNKLLGYHRYLAAAGLLAFLVHLLLKL